MRIFLLLWVAVFSFVPKLGTSFLTCRLQSRQTDPPTSSSSCTKAAATTVLEGDDVVEVVLFGVGDLRVDDHGGLVRALLESSENNNPILPLFVLDNDMLSQLPGAVTHTFDTAQLLAAALSDLQQSLQDVEAKLHIVSTTTTTTSQKQSSLMETLVDLQQQMHAKRLQVHVCDLGPVDNALGYGPFSQLLGSTSNNLDNNNNNNNIQVIPWTQHLREEPWKDIDMLPDQYPVYQREYQSTIPKEPLSLPSHVDATRFVSIPSLQSIPSVDDITNRLVDILELDRDHCLAEQNTGLFATHWGGLDATTVGASHVSNTLQAYTEQCQQRDDLWSQQDSYYPVRHCHRNGRSLEHAAMMWQLRGSGTVATGTVDNWLPGESMVRYMAAPLLFGTVSPRRIWHAATKTATQQQGNLFFQRTSTTSPLQQLVESREWHQLLAAHNLETDPAYQRQHSKRGGMTVTYKYWRYHGFLCRYVQADFEEDDEESTDKEGVLLIHGFGASGAQWNKAMTELSQQQTNALKGGALAPDLLGFGQSEKPAVSYTSYLWESFVTDFIKEQGLKKNGWKSYVVGGNSIGGFTSMSLAACDSADATSNSRTVTSSGAPGTQRCSGLVLMNSAGPIYTKEEIEAVQQDAKGELQLETVAQVTALDALPACKPPPRPLARVFGNILLFSLRPNIQSICTNLYPTNPDAVDDNLCEGILRDSRDPGANNVMMSGAKLPPPRTANELLQADFGAPHPTQDQIQEATFSGPVLIAQGILDPLNNATDRMYRYGALRQGITIDPIAAGHCPHDELPAQIASKISSWMTRTRAERMAHVQQQQSSLSKSGRR